MDNKVDEKQNNENTTEDRNITTNTPLTNQEREELEILRKKEELRNKPTGNVYDKVSISPKTLTWVIVVGIVALIAVVVYGVLTK